MCDVPRVVVYAVPGSVPGFLILGPRVEWLPLVSPLLRAVVAGDDRPVSRGLADTVGL